MHRRAAPPPVHSDDCNPAPFGNMVSLNADRNCQLAPDQRLESIVTCISTIDIQTRLDVQELLSRFSHFLDHDRGACWADLFTTDGVFGCADGNRVIGAAELATLPSLVTERGHGAWRHLITAVVIERRTTRKDLIVRAYCPVIDMNQHSALAAFYDIDFTLRFASRWRIAQAVVRRVGAETGANVGAAAITSGALPRMALQ